MAEIFRIVECCFNLIATHLVCLCLSVCLSICLSVMVASLTSLPQQSEHVDHDFAQLVVLVALLRKHFEQQQEFHAHTPVGKTHQPRQKPSRGQVRQAGGTRKKLSALERAKMKLASSFDNLKGRRQQQQQQRAVQRSNTDEVQQSGPSVEGDGAEEEMRPRSSSSPRNLTVPAKEARPAVVNGLDRSRRPGSFRLLRRRSPVSSSEDLSGGDGAGEREDSSGSGGDQSDDQKSVQSAGEEKPETFSADVKVQLTSEKTNGVVDSHPCSAVALPSSPTSKTPPKSLPKSPPVPHLTGEVMVTSQSFPPVFKTPVRPAVVKHRSVRPRARHSLVQQHHRQAFTPPSSGGPSSGSGRGHRRTMSWRQELFESVTPSKERHDSSECM